MFTANIMSDLGPIWWAVVVGVIGSIGLLLALCAWSAIAREMGALKKASIRLLAEEEWADARPTDKSDLSKWLRIKKINSNSHLGDFIEACWSAWLGGRTASLSELHSLVARRERSRVAVRLSGGIAAVLLVIGIVGTLASIHPILTAFRIKVSSVGAVEDASKNADLVNALVNDLGNAFYPSLAALFATVVVVFVRGGYSLWLYKFSRNLDQFAIDILIPQYRVSSLKEQYLEVKESLVGVSDSILKREGKFEEAIGKMSSFIKDLPGAIDDLKTTTSESNEAAKNLASASKSVSSSLTRNLGKKSPLYNAVDKIENVYIQTNSTLESVVNLVEDIKTSNESSRDSLAEAVGVLISTTKNFKKEQEKGMKKVDESVESFSKVMRELPIEVSAVVGSAVETSVDQFQSGVEDLTKNQKREHADLSDQLKKQTAEAVVEINASAQKITGHVASINNCSDKLIVAQEGVSGGVVILGEQLNILDQATRTVKEETGKLGTPIKTIAELSNKADNSAKYVSDEVAKMDKPIRTLTELSGQVAKDVNKDPKGQPKEQEGFWSVFRGKNN